MSRHCSHLSIMRVMGLESHWDVAWQMHRKRGMQIGRWDQGHLWPCLASLAPKQGQPRHLTTPGVLAGIGVIP
jgi:hypothetical protein